MANPAPNFDGLRVAALESRLADQMRTMIQRSGGQALVSPSMREVSLDDQRAAVDFAHLLLTGQIDVVLLMTGVGLRHLVAAVERHVDRQRFLDALSDVTTIVRGPKPTAVLRELGLTPTSKVPEPHTWREILEHVDRHHPMANQTVALQEYGQPNPSLVAGLEARGARVLPVPVYRWALPEDTGPLEENVRAMAEGRIDVILFTSAQQVRNMLEVAKQVDCFDQLRDQIGRIVFASIGPTTSECLRQCGLPVDLEPEHPKMGQLVTAAAKRSRELLERKRRVASIFESGRGNEPGETAPWYNSPFMKACRREPCDRVPIWLMRQAGRYMAEYRAVREKVSFLELCRNPSLCAEVMVTAVDRLGVDAAIIFSDLLPILEPMGLDLEFAAGEGPVIHNPVRESSDVDRVIELEDVERLDYVIETVRQTRAALDDNLPLIGFAGAPFTLASYAIEGGGSRNYLHTKTLMYRDPVAWDELMQRISGSVARYLTAQIAAGAQVVQIFDSWVGCLGTGDYRQYVLPHTRSVIEQLPAGAPVIHFATGNPALLPLLAEAGGDCIGIDWRVPLDVGWQQVGFDRAVQGNLDPAVLMSTRDEIRARAAEILQQAAGRPGHIFNLGHGVLPQTPVDNAVALVEAVHEMGPAAS